MRNHYILESNRYDIMYKKLNKGKNEQLNKLKCQNKLLKLEKDRLLRMLGKKDMKLKQFNYKDYVDISNARYK